MKKERPLDTVRRLQQVPVLFIHGSRDAIVGMRHSQRLYAAAPEPKRLECIEGSSHAEALFRDAPQGFMGLVAPWFSQTLEENSIVSPKRMC
jgi:fermentation-respiration switch protein FrsA (DUF1100 family)